MIAADQAYRAFPRRVRGAVIAVLVGVGVLLVPGPARAATTMSVDNLSSGQMLTPGPLTVAGHTDGSAPGETVRVLLDAQDIAAAPVDAAGHWSASFDTGPLGDGPHVVNTDVPSAFGGTVGTTTLLYVDQDPDDIQITSPAAGASVTSLSPDGLVVTGRVAHPDLVPVVFPIVGNSERRELAFSVRADGTFRIAVSARTLPQGPQRLAVVAECLTWSRCGAMGTTPITVTLDPTASVTTPTVGQAISMGTVMAFGVQVDNPGPDDSVTGTVDGTIALRFGGALTQSPTRGLYWSTLGIPYEIREGRHSLRITATLRGRTRTLPDVPFVIDLTPPDAPQVAVAAPTQLATSIALAWSGRDDTGITGYDVRYRTSSATASLGGYTYPAALQHTTVIQATLPATAGLQYCFSVRARDAADHVTDWTSESCALTPYDDRWLTASKGATARTGSTWYRATATTLTSRGTATRAGVTASRVGVVAQGCPTCGAIDVTLAGVKLGQINLRLRTTARITTWLPSARARTGTLVITSRGAGPVTLDGVLITRP
jgi:hypothetical protein